MTRLSKTRLMACHVVLFLFGVLGRTNGVIAQPVIALSQDRLVSSSSSSSSFNPFADPEPETISENRDDSDMANDFGNFDAVASADTFNVTANAEQVSAITPTLITATGSAAVHDIAIRSDEEGGVGNAESTFSVDFQLEQETAFTFTGMVNVSKIGNYRIEPGDEPQVLIDLTGPNTSISLFASDGNFGELFIDGVFAGASSFDLDGLLEPGVYQLTANASSSILASDLAGGTDGVTTSYAFDFVVVPEPANVALIGAALISLLAWRCRPT